MSAGGKAGTDSDVDLVVQFGRVAKAFAAFLDLTDSHEQRLGRRVELVTTEALSPYLRPPDPGKGEERSSSRVSTSSTSTL